MTGRRSRIMLTVWLLIPIGIAVVLWIMMPKSGPPRAGNAPPPGLPERNNRWGTTEPGPAPARPAPQPTQPPPSTGQTPEVPRAPGI